MKIKTLAEILAESDTDSASSVDATRKRPSKRFDEDTHKKVSAVGRRPTHTDKRNKDNSLTSKSTVEIESVDALSHHVKKTSNSKKRKKRFHPAAKFIAEPSDIPAYKPPEAQSIKEMLAEVKHNVHDTDNETASLLDTSEESHIADDSYATASKTTCDDETSHQTDNLPAALKAYLRTPEQRQADIDAIKAESRLRWLAFYYLSRREYGKAELKQKLIDKEQNPEKIDALLNEFEEKGYQSDYRTTLMLIRENIRKGRGRGRIKQEFYRKKITMPGNIDELIDMANSESEEFSEFVDDSADSLVDGIDWLKLAVIARTKKYGNDIPTEQKDKARQLRFLQYRGFNTDVCFEALNYTLDTLDERF
ncbi:MULTISPECIES: regulatory protein RecX [Psychrobacter]|uniref:Regulatory protein RecX n=1 Tax=Psychrobacter alimentarius TaxID=261164 RepID=A0ABN4N486_9GAMM|nr:MULTISPECIES: regulatory protein RecX [Psychrobacter]AMT97818.1 Regulatory protein RecX [Psychrobacter alimentarius]QCB29902.1 regulatory protein RecX [Psychrobacter sp. PAMC27889]